MECHVSKIWILYNKKYMKDYFTMMNKELNKKIIYYNR